MTQDFFHTDAEAYDRFMGRWSKLLASLLVDFTGPPDNAHVLDVGCGTGSLAAAIAGRKPHCRVVSVDFSKEYVAYASARNRISNIRFGIGDAQRLAFEDATFDASLSLLVFNFLPDAQKALAELQRVTRPHGRIASAVWDYGGGMQMLRIFWDAAVAVDPGAERLDEKHMPLCRAGELRQLWNQGGLEGVKEQSLEIAMNFQSFEDYWNPFLLGQGPAGSYVKQLAPDRVSALREEAKSRLPLTNNRNPFSLRARAWAVRGDVRAS